MRNLLFALLLSMMALPLMAAAMPLTLNLWPGLAPGETTSDPGHVDPDHGGDVTRLAGITCPRVLIYGLGDAHPRPAILVCPGGAYSILAADLEGSEVAQWLNTLGYVAVVLHYRVPDKRDAAFQDVERAMSVLRSRSKEFGIDPHHLGVLGFSAGGHLSARLASNFGTRAYPSVDAADRTSCRPDFALLIYPAYLIDKGTGQPAPEVAPRAEVPPMFLMQTEDDANLTAPAYAAALEQAGVPTRCVIYPTGGHGYGLRLAPDQPAHAWPAETAAWLRERVGRTNPG